MEKLQRASEQRSGGGEVVEAHSLVSLSLPYGWIYLNCLLLHKYEVCVISRSPIDLYYIEFIDSKVRPPQVGVLKTASFFTIVCFIESELSFLIICVFSLSIQTTFAHCFDTIITLIHSIDTPPPQ